MLQLDLDGRVMWAGAAVCAWCGVACEQMRGRWIGEFLASADGAQLQRDLPDMTAVAGQAGVRQVGMLGADAVVITLHLSYFCLCGQDGAPAFLWCQLNPADSAADTQAPAVPHRRTVLLVDDEANILAALKRLLRPDGYEILTAGGGQQALEVMSTHEVDVILSDQRMPGMLGVDFLRAAKGLYPDTIRIMLSGYTELQSVTDAVNEGAIYKFLTKPWDDELLRGHVADAFRVKEIGDDNKRLNEALRRANSDLATSNRKLEILLRQQQEQIVRDGISLTIARELLEYLPLAVIGLDDAGVVAFVNASAASVFGPGRAVLGQDAAAALPELFAVQGDAAGVRQVWLEGRCYRVLNHPMGAHSQSRGSLLTLSPWTQER